MMIRELETADRSMVEVMLQKNTAMSGEEMEQVLQTGSRLVAMQDGFLVGFAALTPGSPGAYSVVVIVEPGQRRQGVGASLWQQLSAALSPSDRYVCCHCPAQNDNGRAFLRSVGFAPWFSDDLMHYPGPSLPESKLTVKQYRDEDCSSWTRLINEGFYPLRSAIDIEPYNVFRDDAANDPATRQRLLNSGDEKLLFYDDGQLVGLAAIAGSEIDPITVVSNQRGRGYGKQIMAYCTNRILERGISPARLSVLRINISARRLYERVGYRLIEQHDWFRLKLR